MQFFNRLLLFSFTCYIMLAACNTGKNPAPKSEASKTWDTTRLKSAVNDYLRTHEKYYTLIDSIQYDFEPLNSTWILNDQASYYTFIANILSRQNEVQYVIPPGSHVQPPEPPHNRYYDSAAFYYQRSSLAGTHDWLGYRVFIHYRLSDVMLTYSDFTPYLFYFDTAYQRLNKKDYLHYTDTPLDPPNQSGVYLDTPYPYVPAK